MEKGLEALFLSVVNIVSLKSNLLLCGPAEKSLAEEAFGGEINAESTMMDLGSRVSRKKDYIPAITQAVKAGWTKPSTKRDTLTKSDLGELFVDPVDPYQRVRRRGSVLVPKPGTHFDVSHSFACN